MLGVDEEKSADEFECVEIYMPKRLKYQSKLYGFLRAKVHQRLADIVFDGFSIYEVDGVFRGEVTWEERTLVIRILFPRSAVAPAASVKARISDLGQEIAETVAPDEEEIWICHYPQSVAKCRRRRVAREGKA